MPLGLVDRISCSMFAYVWNAARLLFSICCEPAKRSVICTFLESLSTGRIVVKLCVVPSVALTVLQWIESTSLTVPL